MVNSKRWVLALVSLCCLLSAGPASSEQMTAEQLLTAVSQKRAGLQDFQADMTIGIQMLGKMMKMESTLWQKGKLFRVEMTLPPEMMPTGNKQAEPMRTLMVFDGKTMWQSMPMMNMVIKIDSSAIEGRMNNAPYSMPSLPYTLSEKQRNGKGYYFLTTKDVNKFIQNSSMSGLNLPANMPFRSIGVWVNKATLFPELIEFYAQDKTPGIYVEFKNIETNQGLSADLFAFQVPKDAQVMDMTASMKTMAAKIQQQSVATDTTLTETAPE
jgi:outer membrane lipoprotein-sorting protein